MSRITRFMRLMHTSGRQIPNPGQGGAPLTGTTSPSPHSHHPLPHMPQGETLPDFALDPSAPTTSGPFSPSSADLSAVQASRKYTPKGKPIPFRPARAVAVNLPSGYPEPPSYPPPPEYFEGLEERKKDPHPLWQFFHVPPSSRKQLDKNTAAPLDGGSLEVPALDDENLRSGRSWAASELRTKSFEDLHVLWYLLLRERNVLATQREERRRLGVNAREGGDLITKRAFRCRKSMARIKYVLNERRLALLAAASPHLQTPPPQTPLSLLTDTDPSIGVAALRNKAEIPQWIVHGPQQVAGSVGEDDIEIDEDAEDAEDAVVSDEEVAKEEVESRDEGFGGGEEAKEFVRDTEIKDGHVEKTNI